MHDRENVPEGEQKRRRASNAQSGAAALTDSSSESPGVSDRSRFQPPLWAMLAQSSPSHDFRSGKGEPVEGVLAGNGSADSVQQDAQALTTDTPSAVVAGKARISQTVAISTVDGPNDLGYGGCSWKVWYSMASASGAAGWVIQEVTASFSTSGATMRSNSYHYWEAWEVEKGKKVTVLLDKGLDDNDDLYYCAPAAKKTKGENKLLGVVKFYEGPLPADFKTNNPSTIAGILHSTTTKPPFWDGTGTTHNITATWDDTGSAPTPSVTVGVVALPH